MVRGLWAAKKLLTVRLWSRLKNTECVHTYPLYRCCETQLSEPISLQGKGKHEKNPILSLNTVAKYNSSMRQWKAYVQQWTVNQCAGKRKQTRRHQLTTGLRGIPPLATDAVLRLFLYHFIGWYDVNYDYLQIIAGAKPSVDSRFKGSPPR